MVMERLVASEEAAMVMVQLKEEVVSEQKDGQVSESVFSCPCLQEAFPDFLSLPLGPPLCQWWS